MNLSRGRWALLGAMALVAGGSAMAQQGAPPGTPPQTPQQKHEKKLHPMEDQAVELGKLMLADGEPGFLAQLHDINLTEISLGEMAQQKGYSPAVRQYGEHMVRDHKKADQQLMDYAKQHGVQLGGVVPQPTNDVQRRLQSATAATKAKLSMLQGSLFEQEYLASQVASHDETIQLMMLARQQYPNLASLLDGLLPTLREHRDQAYQLLGQVKPQAQAQAGQQPPQQPQQRQARPPPGERR
jgi:putative membrane protein